MIDSAALLRAEIVQQANDPANSALLELVQRQCGSFVMPRGCTANPCISAADLATITTWIQAGAPGP